MFASSVFYFIYSYFWIVLRSIFQFSECYAIKLVCNMENTFNNVFKLDDNRLEAMKKALRVKEIYSKLPQLDCGNCGAPSCMAFAEDVVRGMDVKCRIHTEVD